MGLIDSLAGIGSVVKGVGSLASAWGAYEMGQNRTKLLKDQLNYEKSKDAFAMSQLDKRQNNIDDAFGVSEKKKKRKKDGANLIPASDTFSVA